MPGRPGTGAPAAKVVDTNAPPGQVGPLVVEAAAAKFSSVRLRLRAHAPFFFHLLMYVEVKWSTEAWDDTAEQRDVSRAATDGKSFYFNADWFTNAISDKQAAGAMLHEVLHCALRHFSRRGSREGNLWNIAGDSTINYMIFQQYTKNEVELPINIVRNDELAAKHTTEEIYDILQKQREEDQKKDREQQKKKGPKPPPPPPGGGGSPPPPPGGGGGSPPPPPGGGGDPPPPGDSEDKEDDDDDSIKDPGNGPTRPGKPTKKTPPPKKQGKGTGGTPAPGPPPPKDGDDKGAGDGKPGDEKGDDGQAGEQDDNNGGKRREPRPWEKKTGCYHAPDKPLNQDEQDKLDEQWKHIKDIAAKKAREAGKMPAGIERVLEREDKPLVDWRRVLEAFVTRSADDFNGPYDRRFIYSGIYNDTLEGSKVKVRVAIDTSGSMGAREIGAMLTEVEAMLDAYPSLTGTGYWVDAEAHGPIPIQEMMDARPMGGGGTDFRAFFDAVAIEVESEPDDGKSVNIYLTDGYGSFPAVEPEIPTLWVVTAGGMPEFNERGQRNYPFGEVVMLVDV